MDGSVLSTMAEELWKIAAVTSKQVPEGAKVTKSLKQFQRLARPGDILLSRVHGPQGFSRLISITQRIRKGGPLSAWTHAGLYVGKGKIRHSYERTKGRQFVSDTMQVRDQSLGALDKVGRDFLLLRPNVSADERKLALKRTKGLLGKKYTFTSAARAAVKPAKKSEKDVAVAPQKIICTAVPAFGYPLIDFAREKSLRHMLPVDYIKSDDVEPVAVYSSEEEKVAARKKKEFAPGIPVKGKITKVQKVTRPQSWEFSLQRHVPEHSGPKAPEHLDLRLGNPRTGVAHSWVLPKAEMPKPGESRYRIALQTQDHDVKYMDFEGTLPPGYGQGPVKLESRQKVDVYHASDRRRAGEGKIRFNLYTSRGPEEFALRRLTHREIEDAKKKKVISRGTDPRRVWALHNKTKTQKKMQLPLNKPKYKEVSPRKKEKQEEVLEDPNTVLMPKLQGSHNLVFLEKGKIPRVISYREPKKERPGGVIEHTHKIREVLKKKVPPGLGNTVLRGETIAVDRQGKAISEQEIGGLLNSAVWKSRQEQKKKGVRLVQTIFDVARWRGKDVSEMPYEKKLEILKKVQGALPHLRVPEVARTPEQKKKLLAKIKAGQYKLTTEGGVAHQLKGGPPIKLKFDDDFDVYVRKIFQERKKVGTPARTNMAGGFEYSYTPEGPIVGRVGTGFKHGVKQDMLEHPENYVGRAARIIAEKKLKSGKLSKPRFDGCHLDKGEQPMEA